MAGTLSGMRHKQTQRPFDPYPLHEAVVDILETYVSTWWASDAIAVRLSANAGSVRKAILRRGVPGNVISRVNPDTGVTEYQATCRAYLHEDSAA